MSLKILDPVLGVEKSSGLELSISSGIISNIGVFKLIETTKTYDLLMNFTPHQIHVQGRPYSELTRQEQEQVTRDFITRKFKVMGGDFIIS